MLSLDVVGNFIRGRGLLQPRSVAEDVIAVAVATTTVAAVYVDLARKRDTGNHSSVRDQGFEGHVSTKVTGKRLLTVAEVVHVM